jgi:hypothetical protein
MSGAILPLPQYAFMVWCSVKAQGQLYLLPFTFYEFLLTTWRQSSGIMGTVFFPAMIFAIFTWRLLFSFDILLARSLHIIALWRCQLMYIYLWTPSYVNLLSFAMPSSPSLLLHYITRSVLLSYRMTFRVPLWYYDTENCWAFNFPFAQ